jgi:hypothetical protein
MIHDNYSMWQQCYCSMYSEATKDTTEYKYGRKHMLVSSVNLHVY